MKAIALLLCAAVSALGAMKERYWMAATLTQTAYASQKLGVDAFAFGGFASARNVRATWEAFELDAGDIVYQVMCKVTPKWTPDVTVRGIVRYAIEKNTFYLMDEQRREFKMTVIQKRLK